ncbi:MAG: circularly permuted type 2 ATP-grasp protein [Pseudomonadota bacterium]
MSAPLVAAAQQGEALGNLLAHYQPQPGRYDELLAADGSIRPHWRPALERMASISEAERRHAFDIAQRTLAENGLSYVAKDSEDSQRRPWQLDLLPVLLDAEDWRQLETGLIQRANLLNAITADLYGPQQLVREGLIPAGLVHANRLFCRPCHGISVPNDTWLHLLAFDLVRGADGRWVVVSDRTEAPSGSGFALENRIIVSRALPHLFAASNAQRLAGFFRAFGENFLSLSNQDQPLVLVLTAGKQQDSYFEHVYLAQYLGYGVVEGADLTVRGDRLYLKTVEGLKPVDLLVRQADSLEMDPLELVGTDSGVPGLMRALRGGRVVLANAIGSGVAQSDALMPYLPALSRRLLGEELALESVETWWSGAPEGRAQLLANLDRLALRDLTMPKALLGQRFGSDGSVEPDSPARDALEAQMTLRGYDFVGRALPPASTTPLWTDDGALVPAPMTLRVYLAATADGYRVLPGGLARVTPPARAAEAERGLLLDRAQTISKDTWVVSERPVERVSLLPGPRQVVALRRSGRELPSRAADDLYWLGRSLERLEGAVRLLRSFESRVVGAQRAGSDQVSLGRVVELLAALQHLSKDTAERFKASGASAFFFQPEDFFADEDCADNLASLLAGVERLGEGLRVRLSRDTWELLQELLSAPLSEALLPGYGQDRATRLLDELVAKLSALNGLVMENMTRDFGWRFLDMGRRLERGWRITRSIHAIAGKGEAEREGGLELLLEQADSLMTYSWRYKAEPQLAPILDLLLVDDSNPRALLFQVDRLTAHLKALPEPGESRARLSQTDRLLIGLSSSLQLADIHKLTEGGPQELDRLLDQSRAALEEVSDAITERFFSHALETRVSGAGVANPKG